MCVVSNVCRSPLTLRLQRGYPNTAQIALMHVESGAEGYRTAGRQCFKDGSNANGAAMKIAPLGLAFRAAADSVRAALCGVCVRVVCVCVCVCVSRVFDVV